MRVIAGTHRSRRLFTLKDDSVRPTADRVKESLFNILQNKIVDAAVLDLFCGSGSLGIESISRGAKSVVFVDFSKGSIAACKQNLDMLREPAEVILSDFRTFLTRTDKKFDIIFIDPPYSKGLCRQAIEIIFARRLLNEGGVAVCEDAAEGSEEDFCTKRDCRTYSNCSLTFYTYKQDELPEAACPSQGL